MTYYSLRKYIAMILAIISLCSACSTTQAQTIVIQPGLTPNGPAQLLNEDILVIDDGTWPERIIHLEAFLVQPNGTYIPITNVATWTSSDASVLAATGGGLFQIGTSGQCEIHAALGSLNSEAFTFRWTEQSTNFYQTLLDAPAPIPQIALEAGAVNILTNMAQNGIPTAGLVDAASRVAIADDSGITNIFGMPRPFLGSGVDGMFVPRGLEPNGLRFLYTSSHLILLKANHAQSIAENNGINPQNGRLTVSARLLIHEIMHAVVYFEGIAVSEDDEEAIVHAIESIIIPAMEDIADILSSERPTRIQLWRLRHNLTMIRAKIRSLRDLNREALDAILRALGWQDEDDNGFPDFIDDWMRQRGLDYDTLPTTPYDDPGDSGECGPAVPDETPKNLLYAKYKSSGQQYAADTVLSAHLILRDQCRLIAVVDFEWIELP